MQPDSQQFGWYLIVPPLRGRYPLGVWHILKIYDSAKRCYDERDHFVFEAQKKKTPTIL